MVIYGEYLFIENMFTGLLVLLFTAKVLGTKVSWLRMLCGGICCGGYAFILFLPLSGLPSLTMKVLFSFGIAVLVYGRASLLRVAQNAMVFLAVTILYGGVAMAVLISFGWTGVTAAAGVYLPPLTYISITAAAVFSGGVIWMLIQIFSVKRRESRTRVEAVVQMGDRSFVLQGLIDSGNTLREPLSGKPVCLVKKETMDLLTAGVEDLKRRYTVIPYRSVGVEAGTLWGYRGDALLVGARIWKGPVIAVCEEKHFFQNGQGIEILLPEVMLERGLYGDD